jgi:DNA-binding transcriptional MerR regulator
MAWSIAEVARMSRTTSRTLRHYHAIGLLVPAYVGGNGYRYYEREQLLRLQQILVLRELGLGLPVIARVLDGQQDTAAALRSHLRRLHDERSRLLRLQRTVERTLSDIQEGQIMPAEEIFSNFDPKRQEAYERELVERLGEGVTPHIEESRRKTAGWTENDFGAAMTDFHERLRLLADEMRQGHDPGGPEAQALIAGHHEWLTSFLTADSAAYTGLGELYAGDERFRDQIEAIAPGLAGYLRDAMAIYARDRLA